MERATPHKEVPYAQTIARTATHCKQARTRATIHNASTNNCNKQGRKKWKERHPTRKCHMLKPLHAQQHTASKHAREQQYTMQARTTATNKGGRNGKSDTPQGSAICSNHC